MFLHPPWLYPGHCIDDMAVFVSAAPTGYSAPTDCVTTAGAKMGGTPPAARGHLARPGCSQPQTAPTHFSTSSLRIPLNPARRPVSLFSGWVRWLTWAHLPLFGQGHTVSQKRAFNRACRRAAASPLQGTFYRGKFCSVMTLGNRRMPDRAACATRSKPPETLPENPRLRVVTYNVGGFSSDAYMERLQSWPLYPWSASLTFFFFRRRTGRMTLSMIRLDASTASSQAGGLAVFLSSHLCDSGSILHSALLPGRLLHVRLQLTQCTVDVVNVYQKVNNTSLAVELGAASHATAKQVRREVWNALSQLLRTLPSRHILILGGDFNTPVEVVPQLVGARARLFPSVIPPDAALLKDICVDHDLLHLNSWTRFAKPTFRGPSGCSLIDHLFIRHNLGDAQARAAGPQSWVEKGRLSPSGSCLC